MLAAIDPDDGTRGWLRCVVQPSLEYLGTSPEPTYFGVFCVQMAAMPGTTGLLFRETTATPSVQGDRERAVLVVAAAAVRGPACGPSWPRTS